MPKITTRINLTIGKDTYKSGTTITVSDDVLKELKSGFSAKYIDVVEEKKKTKAVTKKDDTAKAE